MKTLRHVLRHDRGIRAAYNSGCAADGREGAAAMPVALNRFLNGRAWPRDEKCIADFRHLRSLLWYGVSDLSLLKMHSPHILLRSLGEEYNRHKHSYIHTGFGSTWDNIASGEPAHAAAETRAVLSRYYRRQR